MERTDIAKLIKTADEPRGFSSKYWVDDGTKKLIKYNNPTFQDGDVMESLAANVLNCLKVDVVNVHLGYNSDNEFLEKENISSPNCCIVDNFLTKPGDVSISLMGYRIPKVNTGNEQKNISSCFYKVFNMFDSLPNIDEMSANRMKMDYIRIVFGDCIINNEDRHIKNIEAIYNEREHNYRLAPSFDNAVAFNAYNIGAEEGYCCVGNQDFEATEVLKYITAHHLDCVEDIIYNLNNLAKDSILHILSDYREEISSDKLAFIYEYINRTNDLTQEMINKEDSKTKK